MNTFSLSTSRVSKPAIGAAIAVGLSVFSGATLAQQDAAEILSGASQARSGTQADAPANHAMANRLARALDAYNDTGRTASSTSNFESADSQPADYALAADIADRLHDHNIATSVETARAESQRRVSDIATTATHPKADEIAQRLADYYANNGTVVR